MSEYGRALIAQLDADDLAHLRRMLGLDRGAGDDGTADELLTVEEAAARARCHAETIRRAIRGERLTASRVGSSWRVSAADLAAWLQHPTVERPSAQRTRQRARARQHSDRVSDAFSAARAAA